MKLPMKKILISAVSVVVFTGTSITYAIVNHPADQQNKPVKESHNVTIPTTSPEPTEQQQEPEQTIIPTQTEKPVQVAPVQPKVPTVSDLSARYGWNTMGPQVFAYYSAEMPAYFDDAHIEKSAEYIYDVGVAIIQKRNLSSEPSTNTLFYFNSLLQSAAGNILTDKFINLGIQYGVQY